MVIHVYRICYCCVASYLRTRQGDTGGQKETQQVGSIAQKTTTTTQITEGNTDTMQAEYCKTVSELVNEWGTVGGGDTQQIIPNTQQVIPNTQQIIPNTQQVTPNAQQIIPNYWQVNTQQVDQILSK